MKGVFSIILLVSIFLFSLVAAQSQELALRKGTVVDSLQINDSMAESFAMYLPTNYSSEKSWPIVFVFDEEGRGINVARLFSVAAEEQGYLVVASNSVSKKDSVISNIEVASRLLESIFQSFPIDKNRMYTAGLDAGAMVAGALPAVYPDIKGVLLVGDIYINKDFLDSIKEKHTIVSFAGYKSGFYNKLNYLTKLLNRLDYKSLGYYYDGLNEWPSSKLISHGIGVFTLDAMLTDNKDVNPEMVDHLFRDELASAESLRRQLKFYKAFELLELMQDKYKEFDKKKEIRDFQKEIRREAIYKDQRSQYVSAKIMESNLKYNYRILMEEDILSENFENLGWWMQQYKEIDSLKKSSIVAEEEMAFRQEAFLQEYAKTRFEELQLAEAGIDRLILTSILRTIFDKENPEPYFSIISLSAQDGDYYTSLLYLEDLLRTGYDEMEELYDIPGTLDLKLSPEFNQLVKKYLGESKYYNVQL